MKRAMSLILALVMCLSLCACGGGKVTNESVAGRYESLLWFLDMEMTINANTTYSIGNKEKGTFTIQGKKLHTNSTNNRSTSYIVDGDMIYATDWWAFEKDEEFKLKFTPDANGRADQTFSDAILNETIPGSKYNKISLDLDSDGTFELVLGWPALGVSESFEGTYSYTDSKLTLTYEGEDYPLAVSDEGEIFFLAYRRI